MSTYNNRHHAKYFKVKTTVLTDKEDIHFIKLIDK